jgi:hypothetical protein
MLNEIDAKLKEAEQNAHRLDKIEAMLESLRADKMELERKKHHLQREMEKEQLDVDKLENNGLVGLFYMVLGKHGEKLEKEKSEALAAKLKYDQSVKELDEVTAEIDKLRTEKMKYKDSHNIYNTLYSQKKEMVKKSGTKASEDILDLEAQLRSEENMLKEVREAIDAGKSALAYLDRAGEHLGSARSYGVWDMLGGGLLADIAKHSHIDDAKSAVEAAQSKLRKFKTELADIDISQDIRIETDGFAKFADFFFDGLIADWSMQNRIAQSQWSVSNAAGTVNSVLRKLETMERETNSKISNIKAEIKRLILES